MKLPHFLHLAPSGVFHFRQRIPCDLRPVFGRLHVKASLHTRDPRTAQARALWLAARYALAFDEVRGHAMPKPDLSDLLKAARGSGRFEVELDAKGALSRLRTDGSSGDNAAALKALELLTARPVLVPGLPPARPAPSATRAPTLTMGKAAAEWLAGLKAATLAKTYTQKAAAVEGFAKHYGEGKPLAEVHRTDVAAWLQALRAGGLATPTLTNKASYLRGFFKAMHGAGYYPHSDNPAQGQVVYGTREKRQRRALGFTAYPLAHVQKLYAPAAVETLSPAARWGALIGLYTGARVSEVGQLALADFVTEHGLPCLRFTDEGRGQSLKNDASARTIPLHADLLALGLMERVESLRLAGETRFFPKLKPGAVNGAGQWLSKAFSRHLAGVGVKPEGKGRYGFHSLRKTVVQGLQGG